jgi:mono/diheme cytochrome c family protein
MRKGYARTAFVLTCLAVSYRPAGAGDADRGAEEFRKDILPFLQQHCVKCHGPQKPKGGLNVQALDPDLVQGKDLESWKAVAERLTLGEMPPESEPRPDARRVEQVLIRLKTELARGGEDAAEAGRKLLLPGHGNRVDHTALFAGTVTAPAASPARVWRMSPQNYAAFIPRITG